MGEAFGAGVIRTKGRGAGAFACGTPQEVNRMTMIISPRRGSGDFNMNRFKCLCANHGTEVGNTVPVGVDAGAVRDGDRVRVLVEEGVPVGCNRVGVLLGACVWLAVGVSVAKMLMMITLGVMAILGTHSLSPGDMDDVERQLAC